MSEELQTVNIKGKPYVLVNERIKAFRKNYAGWSLESEIVELNDDRCVIKAVIKDENGTVKATGTAYELANSTYINKTSYVENCETSAWGRALGNLGIGIDKSIASAEEMQNAVNNQSGENSDAPFPEESGKITPDKVKELEGYFAVYPKDNRETTKTLMLKDYGAESLSDLTTGQFVKFRSKLTDEAEKMKKAHLKSAVEMFAAKSGLTYDEARASIETGINKKLDEIMCAEFPVYYKQIGEMIKGLGK